MNAYEPPPPTTSEAKAEAELDVLYGEWIAALEAVQEAQTDVWERRWAGDKVTNARGDCLRGLPDLRLRMRSSLTNDGTPYAESRKYEGVAVSGRGDRQRPRGLGHPKRGQIRGQRPPRSRTEPGAAGRSGWNEESGPDSRTRTAAAEERMHWEQLQRRRGKELGDPERRSRREWSEQRAEVAARTGGCRIHIPHDPPVDHCKLRSFAERERAWERVEYRFAGTLDHIRSRPWAMKQMTRPERS